MANQRGESARRGRVDPLADARLCADESYYHALARPLVRQGAARRLRDATARAGPLLTAACALFTSISLALAAPASITSASPLAPLYARFGGAPWGLMGLGVGLPLLVALGALSLWARRDRSISLRAEAGLIHKTRLARAYRRYLTELARLTEPLAWARPAIGGATDAGASSLAPAPPAVLVALTMRREPLPEVDELVAMTADDAPLSPDAPTRQLIATKPLTRSGLDSSLDAIRDALHPAQSVESVTQALASAPSGAIILRGDKGAGKTTLLRYVAHAQALAQLNRTQPGGRLPFYADLGWLEDGWPMPSGGAADALEEALAALAQRIGGLEPVDARDLAHALTTEPALLLLDELDTLPGALRERVAESLGAFLAEGRRSLAERESAGMWSAQVALGARTYDGPLGDGGPRVRFEPWLLEPLAYPAGRLALAQGALAQRSAHARPTPPAAEAAEAAKATETRTAVVAPSDEAARLLQSLRHPQTERWLMQPLELTLAALGASDEQADSAHNADAADVAAPRSLTDLHRSAVWRLLGAHLPGWSEAERRALLRLAEETALWLQRAGRRAFRPGEPALDQRLLRLPVAASALARAGDTSPSRVVARSGLCEQGPGGLVSFSLVTLHAFLAGCALARQIASEMPEPLLPDALSPGAADAPHALNPLVALDALDTLDTMALDASASGARLPRPLTPDATPAHATPTPVAVSAAVSAAPAAGQPRMLDLAWANRASERWSDTLLFLCGALCSPDATTAPDQSAPDQSAPHRGDIAVAWLRALLDQRDYLDSSEALTTLGLLLAATSLPELRGASAGGPVAMEIATRLSERLRQHAETVSPAALARLRQACGAALADPTARAALLRLLTDQLLGPSERAARQAARTLGALGRAGASVEPLLIDLLTSTTEATRAAVAQSIGALGPVAGAEAVPALVAALNDHSRAVRAAAVEALGSVVAEPAAATVEAVMARLADRAGEVRAAAAMALGKMGGRLAHLATSTASGSAASGAREGEEVEETPSGALLQRGESVSASVVANALRLALRDHETRVAAAAAYALGLVDTTGSQIPALIEGLTARWNDRAALALGALGALALPALPTLLELSRAESPILRESATRALAQIGPKRADVVATLVARLSDEAPECRRAAADALARIDPAAEGVATRARPALITALDDPRESVRWSAGRALEALGATNDPASLDALFALLDDPRGYIRANAARTLQAISGPQARSTPDRVARLVSARTETCLVAVGELGALSATARDALPTLARLTSDPRWEIRRAALRAMRQIAPDDDRTIARGVAASGDSEALARLEAIEALGRQKTRRDGQILDALQRRLRADDEGAVRAAAARALGRMGPRAARALPLLARALLDRDGEARRAAALAIGALQPDLAKVTPLLIDALAETEPGPRSASALAMGALGPRAAASLTQELLTLLRDEFPVTRAAAAEALGQYGAQVGGPAPTLLLQRLTDRDAEVRAAAATALGQIGARPEAGGYSAQELEEALLARADDQRYVVRRAAVTALTALGPAAVARSLDRILALLTDLNPATRDAALHALATLDPAGRARALALLIGWLGAESADQRAMSAQALAVLRPALDAADRDALSLLLSDGDDATRAAAAAAIGALSAVSFSDGPPPALGRLLGDTAWRARAAAAEALGHFGAQVSAEDRGALREALADRDESIRLAATQALARIEPKAASALIPELLAMTRTRRPIGPLAPLTTRAEGDVYAAMTRPTWTTIERVSSWLSDGVPWATQFDAVSLLGRWGYAPMAARRSMLRLRDESRYPIMHLAARAALQAILLEVGDFEPPAASALSDARPLLVAAAARATTFGEDYGASGAYGVGYDGDDASSARATLAALAESGGLRAPTEPMPVVRPGALEGLLAATPEAELEPDDDIDADTVRSLKLESASSVLEPPLQGAKSFTTYALIDESNESSGEPTPTLKLPESGRGAIAVNGARPAPPDGTGLGMGSGELADLEPTTRLRPDALEQGPTMRLHVGDPEQEATMRLRSDAHEPLSEAPQPAAPPAPQPVARKATLSGQSDMLSGDLSGFLVGGLPEDLAATTRKFPLADASAAHAHAAESAASNDSVDAPDDERDAPGAPPQPAS